MNKSNTANLLPSRIVARDAVLLAIRDKALDIIEERGFDSVTAKDIANEVGISERTFFRYFKTKEDVVCNEPFPVALLLQDELSKQPKDEPVWQALEKTFMSIQKFYDDKGSTSLRLHRLSQSSPELRAKTIEKQEAWAEQLIPELSKRLPNQEIDKAIRAEVLVRTAIVCLNIAVKQWSESEGKLSLSKVISKSFKSIS